MLKLKLQYFGNLIRNVYKKLTANMMLDDERLRYRLLPHLFSIVL